MKIFMKNFFLNNIHYTSLTRQLKNTNIQDFLQANDNDLQNCTLQLITRTSFNFVCITNQVLIKRLHNLSSALIVSNYRKSNLKIF